METILNKSGIKRVYFYTAGTAETCDRCSAGIKNISLVEYRDGITEKYGSECINKILKNAPDMKSLWTKNAKLLKKYTDALEIFSRKPEDMPRGSEYYGSGLYMIADSTGKKITGGKYGHYYFHPIIDAEKNAAGGRYVVADVEANAKKCMQSIEQDKAWFQAEVARIEGFLARIMQKVQKEQELAK